MRFALAFALAVNSAILAEAPPESPGGKNEGAQAEVQKIQKGLVDALGKRPKALAAYLEPLLAEEAVVTDNSAQSYGKANFLELAKSGDREPLPMKQSDVKTQTYGDTVVITGLMEAVGLRQEAYRFTVVYVKRQKQWQIAAIHLTAVTRS